MVIRGEEVDGHGGKKTVRLVLDGASPPPAFMEMVASVGWAASVPKRLAGANWVLLAGVAEVGGETRVTIIAEFSGPLGATAEHLLTCKDATYVTRIICREPIGEAVAFLRRIDGLCRYRVNRRDGMGRPEYESPESAWPHFRSRDAVCRIVSPPADFVRDSMGRLELLGWALASSRIIIRSQCGNLLWAIRQPLTAIVDNPIVDALTWTLGLLRVNRVHGPVVPSSTTGSVERFVRRRIELR